MISVWVSYFANKPLLPILSAHIDLSKHMESMYVGFSAANGNGSAMHVIYDWEFKTWEIDFSFVNKVEEEGDCVFCTQEEQVSNGENNKRKKKMEIAIVEITFASSLLIVIVVGYIIWRLWKVKKLRRDKKRRIELENLPAKLYLSEIKKGTNGFSKNRIIGEGTSATIYKGILFHEQVVAVKRFNNDCKNNLLKPFTTEFATMVQTLKHKNLVQLLGWCCENNELILVYEFLPNGSLDEVLHSSKFVLTWEQRLNIVLGIASCLTYLHEECNKQIIHRDVKTRNVMLDSDFTPKLCDFGFAEVYDKDSKSRKPTIPAGTMGYLAPEYIYTGIPTVKSDVYSFGVVVLEVVSGRRPVEEHRNCLVDWMWSLLEAGKLIEAVDPRMMGKYSMTDMERMLKVGLCCVHFDTNKRPNIREAAMMLTGETLVPVLPAKRPVVMLQTALPRPSKKILINSEADDNFSECFWSSPRTQFSED
ncbi:L-type lectin-domain containing receptor kinase S.6 [Bienertia sinuspersici]